MPPPGFLGRLVPQKNLAYLLEAFRASRRRSRPRVPRAGILGTPSLRRRPNEARNSSLRPPQEGWRAAFTFISAVPHNAVAAAIDQCHLFAFSSITEGQCLAALEILSRGRPIVATPVGAFPEFLIAPELGQLTLDNAALFAQTLHQVGLHLWQGRLTPLAVQRRFANLFPHDRDHRQILPSVRGKSIGGSLSTNLATPSDSHRQAISGCRAGREAS